ncbi:MORC family CW-type zinc finger 3-like protein [Labeo rohita]|uniref:MORC family CW-type zinc finger 3-like protein n=1 Tax=Labeo rohita TaxID=84645 RepID=A0A498NUD6_LABRO|nr:MORC family CW-type zinc finger 3-like protein [Labeo rohita]
MVIHDVVNHNTLVSLRNKGSLSLYLRKMPGGSTLQQYAHCLQKINCGNQRCTKVEKLKALGYFTLLMLRKYRPQNKKWTAQLQCPFELPVVAHAVLEKIVCLFEGLLEACGPVREEVGQQERTGEEEESEREVDDEDQTGQGEQYKLGQTGRWDNMETEAQEDSVEGERVERGEIEEQNELRVVETEVLMGQQERTGEEDKVEGEINDEDQRGQGEKSKIEEIERRDMQEMDMETQKEIVESERVGSEEKELGVMETEEMEADKERQQTEEVGKSSKKKVVAAGSQKV